MVLTSSISLHFPKIGLTSVDQVINGNVIFFGKNRQILTIFFHINDDISCLRASRNYWKRGHGRRDQDASLHVRHALVDYTGLLRGEFLMGGV